MNYEFKREKGTYFLGKESSNKQEVKSKKMVSGTGFRTQMPKIFALSGRKRRN